MRFHTISLYLFFILLFGLSVVIRILPEGFHPDSLVYMSMARNLSEGEYSFWNLHFSNTIFDHFYEHPPLGIYTMSLFFSLFGDTTFIDKTYGLLFGFFIFLEIAAIYRLMIPNSSRNATLLAIFYFLAFPITGYTFENNFLEIEVTFFTLSAVYFFLKSAQPQTRKFLYIFLFASMLMAGFLVKGPVALFPLALPFFYFLLFKEYELKQLLSTYFTAISVLGLFSVILYTYEPSYNYLSNYFQDQIISSISGSRGGDQHFKLLLQLIIDFGSIFLVSLIIISIVYKKIFKPSATPYFWLFILIGLSGSVPLEISPRQSNFYIFPSLPFFAIALSLLFLEPISILLKKFGGYKLIGILNITLLIAFTTLSWQKLHSYRRYKNFYHDFIEANVALPKYAKINICVDNQKEHYEFFDNTEITGNLQRYYQTELFESNQTTPYFLTTTVSDASCKIYSKNYRYIGPKKPNYYVLYARRSLVSD